MRVEWCAGMGWPQCRPLNQADVDIFWFFVVLEAEALGARFSGAELVEG